MKTKEKIILAYSGGLDTSIIIPWLKENYDFEVIAVAVDLGQGKELEGLKEKAFSSGAKDVYIEDVREEFVNDYIFEMLKAQAKYEGKYLMGTLSRPLISKKLAQIAKKEGATAVCHGATGKGNDQVRFEVALKALAPHLKIIAPWRIWDIKSREEAIEYAHKHNIPITASKDRPYSEDRNIWYMSHEGGLLENIQNETPNDIFELTQLPEQASNKPDYISITFQKGIPTKINDKPLSGQDILLQLNSIGKNHGIGIVDIIENRLVGMKSRGVYEAPGGSILYEAHQILESICIDRDTLHYKQKIGLEMASLIYDGKWFSPLRKAISAFVTQTQEYVTGTVKLKLYKGQCYPAGVESPFSIYNESLASFGADALYDQKDATGFINLFGLPAKMQALTQKDISHS